LEDYKALSVPLLWLCAGAAIGPIFVLARVDFDLASPTLIYAVAYSGALATIAFFVGAAFTRITSKKSLGSADPVALFALTLPLTQHGIAIMFMGALLCAFATRWLGRQDQIPLITVLVIAVFNLIIFDLLLHS
jgi:hypothetical protein